MRLKKATTLRFLLLQRPNPAYRFDSRGLGESKRKALHLVLDGVPYGDAACEVGRASHQDLHRAAKRLNLPEVSTTELVSSGL